MVVLPDNFSGTVIYPHAEGKPSINTLHDAITVTIDGKVLLNGREWQPEEVAIHLANLKKAFETAFGIADAAK